MTVRELQDALNRVENKDASISIETSSGLYVMLESVVSREAHVLFAVPEGFKLVSEIQLLLSR